MCNVFNTSGGIIKILLQDLCHIAWLRQIEKQKWHVSNEWMYIITIIPNATNRKRPTKLNKKK